MSISHYVSVLNGIAGAWFSLEMDGVQLTRRLASIDSGISHELIRQGKVPQEYENKFFNSLDRISKAPIYIEDKGSINIRAIRTRANILVRKNGIKYIIVDYLQLMEGVDVKNKNRNDIVGEITRGLKMLAKELNIPVIALSQLSRKVEERGDKMPQMSDLRESGNIEQDADEILFLMRPEKYGLTEPVIIGGCEYDVKGLCIGKADKNRHGECLNFAMSFTGQTMHITTHVNESRYLPTVINNQSFKDEEAPF
jgi:replicative DNA helicase